MECFICEQTHIVQSRRLYSYLMHGNIWKEAYVKCWSNLLFLSGTVKIESSGFTFCMVVNFLFLNIRVVNLHTRWYTCHSKNITIICEACTEFYVGYIIDGVMAQVPDERVWGKAGPLLSGAVVEGNWRGIMRDKHHQTSSNFLNKQCKAQSRVG